MVYVTVCPGWKSVELVAFCLLPFGGEGRGLRTHSSPGEGGVSHCTSHLWGSIFRIQAGAALNAESVSEQPRLDIERPLD